MPLDTGPIRKVLDLEARKGYADRAVMGGLDRFLTRWAAQAAPDVTSPKQLTVLNKLKAAESGYARLSPEKRRQFVDSLVGFLDTIDHPAPRAAPKVPRPAAGRKAARPVAPPQPLDSPTTAVKGISDALAGKFRRLGVNTVRDLLYFFPRRHLDYSQRKPIAQLQEGKEETIVANVWEARLVRIGGPRFSTEATVGDETGNIRVVWFNNPYVARNLKTNDRVVISGRVGEFRGRLVFQSPEWEHEDAEQIHTGRLVPLYHLTAGLGPRQTRRLMKSVVEQWSGELADFLPGEVKARQKLLDLPEAVRQAHFPDDTMLKDRARVRLAFDELFLLQLGVLSKKRDWQEGAPGIAVRTDRAVLDRFLGALPFKLTAAQDKALGELLADLARPQAMSRLLQGDVGSGKTVVATAALLMAVANGYQGAFMAPTEILAEQHFGTLRQLLSRAGPPAVSEDYVCSCSGLLERPLTVALLIGEVSTAAKRDLQERVAAGAVDIVIGTHALIQKDVEFKDLGLAVVDEQHRFGVSQRSALRKKGGSPHILVMTATPIPRTLALTLYGDLDLSVIDQLPAGRQAVKTKWLKPEQRDSAYDFIRRQARDGHHQAFVICPLVEESEAVQAKAATAEYERLSGEVFPDLRLGLLHGRMKADEKDEVMHRFRRGELDVLVATPVVEVGIDVPNATVMLVESADRFGLSQLHQFRGRVGRGGAQSYCLLLAEDPSEVGRMRLDIIERVYDGFKLAEEDLKLRGPGEFFGTRQSGLPDLRMAKLSDVGLLEAARHEATGLFEQDPRLRQPEHKPLVHELARVWPQAAEWS